MGHSIKSFFATTKQYDLFRLLCLTTLLDLALVVYRLVHTDFDFGQLDSFQGIANTRSTTFMFLAWNLVLAWIPYLISLGLEKVPAKRFLAVPALFAWLMFFPNAPYIVTDLLHVSYRPPVPLWYDVVMIFSFAWTGMLLGFLSLLEVQQFMEKRIGKQLASYLVWAFIGLCAFGVYLGRYQRWNTWDLLLEPYQLFWNMVSVFVHPIANIGSLGLAVVMAGVLGVGYLTIRTLVADGPKEFDK